MSQTRIFISLSVDSSAEIHLVRDNGIDVFKVQKQQQTPATQQDSFLFIQTLKGNKDFLKS